MFRFMLILLVVGGALAFVGCQELRISMSAGSTPVKLDVASVESGQVPESWYVELGPHYGLTGLAIYEARVKKHSDRVTNSTPLNVTYYAAISKEHPFVVGLIALEAKYGSLDKAPDAEWPELDNVAVIIKTKRFKTLGQIPDGWQDETGIKGVVINRVESLGSEETKLLKENFPSLDMSKVLVIEQNRAPKGVMVALAMLLGGGGLVLGVVGKFVIGARGGSSSAPTA